ncbi:MAG: AAA family ATPase [Armatimonadia bacterium]|nr:AAA family ATPase [Armatimonadia bacterium]
MDAAKPIRDMGDVDLGRHGVIQASAGTGKTYTMVEIALRALVEGRAKIDELLMITFTEKAAGELRERLRGRLEERIDAADSLAGERILDALDGFSQARISTIHSFCGHILREHAFETGHLLTTRVVDEVPLMEELVTERVRRWGSMGRELLELALEASEKPESWAADAGRWIEQVTRTALTYRPEAGDELVPAPADCDDAALATLRIAADHVADDLARIRGLLGAGLDRDLPLDDQPICRLMHDIGHSGRGSVKTLLESYVVPLLALVRDAPTMGLTVLVGAKSVVDGITERALKAFADRPFDQLHGRLKDAWQERCPELEAIAGIVAGIAERLRDLPLPTLASTTIHQLHHDLKATCRERGLMTFSRMIAEVHEQVTAEGPHGTLATALRRSLRLVIVDEFQDTDRLQWEIMRTAFLTGGEDDPRVFIVGDPKQAIYGFRGADIHSYEMACRHMLEECGAKAYSLDTNYRATPAFISACNWLFSDGRWFEEEGWSAKVRAADVAKVRKAPAQVADDALVLVELQKLGADRVRRAFARYAAREIETLCPSDPAERPRIRLGDADERPLEYSDFCVLVRKRSEVQSYTEAFRERGIPCSFYKDKGLWASDEALHLHYLLRALADPTDPERWRAALLSRFVSAPPEEAMALAECSESHPARRLLRQWVRHARSRQWPTLMGKLLDSCPILLDDLEEAPLEWERRLTNYQQLLQTLERLALAEGWDLLDMLAHVAERRATAGLAEDEDLLRIETAEPAVRIMTMHVSKGLEFPFVFVGGGFTTSYAGQPVQRRYEGQGAGGHWVIDLQQRQRESDPDQAAELRRLYYVATTRASVRAYLPVYEPPQRTPGGYLDVVRKGPLAKAQSAGGCAHVAPVKWTDDGRYRLALPAASTAPGPAEEGFVDGALSRPPAGLAERRSVTASFSSLARPGHDGHRFGEEEVRQDDDPADADTATADLPGGAGVGQFFHDALEDILRLDAPLEALQPEPLLQRLEAHARRWVSSHWLTDEFLQESGAMVRRALTKPLPEVGPMVKVGRENLLPELPFLFPCEVAPEDGDAPADIRLVHGEHGPLLSGVIDLVIRRGDRHYLLDWKSNRLPGYERPRLAEAMRQSRYDLQYSIYAVALERWLRVHLGDSYVPERHLGGIFYIFLRGLDDEGEDGLYFVRPAELDLDRFEKHELPARLRGVTGGDHDGSDG